MMKGVARMLKPPPKVLFIGNPILRKISEEIPLEEIKTQQTRDWLKELNTAIKKYNGVGLAAPQIGITKKIFISEIPSLPGGKVKILPPTTFINPILSFPNPSAKQISYESCLSVPHYVGIVERYQHTQVDFYDEEGNKRQIIADGYVAAVLQHEYDHLEGKLYIDKVKNVITDLWHREEFVTEWVPAGSYSFKE